MSNKSKSQTLALSRTEHGAENSSENRIENVLRLASRATQDATLLQSAQVHALLKSVQQHLCILPVPVLVRWLDAERPTVVASLLSFADPERGSQILARFSELRRVEVLQELAKPKQVTPDVLEVLVLELSSLAKSSSGPQLSRGGEDRAAQLLQALPIVHRERILTELGARDAVLQSRLQKQMVTVEQVSLLLARDLGLVCSLFSNLDLALILRVEKDGVRQKFLQCVSSGRRSEIEELLDVGKPQFKAKVEEAQSRLLQKVVELKDQGRILFPWEQQVV